MNLIFRDLTDGRGKVVYEVSVSPMPSYSSAGFFDGEPDSGLEGHPLHKQIEGPSLLLVAAWIARREFNFRDIFEKRVV